MHLCKLIAEFLRAFERCFRSAHIPSTHVREGSLLLLACSDYYHLYHTLTSIRQTLQVDWCVKFENDEAQQDIII